MTLTLVFSNFQKFPPYSLLMFILRRRKRRIDTIRERIPKDITHNSHKRASQLFNDYTTERNTNFTRLRKAITLAFAFQMAYANEK